MKFPSSRWRKLSFLLDLHCNEGFFELISIIYQFLTLVKDEFNKFKASNHLQFVELKSY